MGWFKLFEQNEKYLNTIKVSNAIFFNWIDYKQKRSRQNLHRFYKKQRFILFYFHNSGRQLNHKVNYFGILDN